MFFVGYEININLNFHLYSYYKLNLDYMRKREMIVWYKGKYLVIVYEFDSYKTCYNHIDRLWVPVPVATADGILRSLLWLLDPRTAKDNSILQCTQQKQEESEYSRNLKCLKNKVARDKYYNAIVLAYSLNYDYIIICNMQCAYCVISMY